MKHILIALTLCGSINAQESSTTANTPASKSGNTMMIGASTDTPETIEVESLNNEVQRYLLSRAVATRSLSASTSTYSNLSDQYLKGLAAQYNILSNIPRSKLTGDYKAFVEGELSILKAVIADMNKAFESTKDEDDNATHSAIVAVMFKYLPRSKAHAEKHPEPSAAMRDCTYSYILPQLLLIYGTRSNICDDFQQLQFTELLKTLKEDLDHDGWHVDPFNSENLGQMDDLDQMLADKLTFLKPIARCIKHAPALKNQFWVLNTNEFVDCSYFENLGFHSLDFVLSACGETKSIPILVVGKSNGYIREVYPYIFSLSQETLEPRGICVASRDDRGRNTAEVTYDIILVLAKKRAPEPSDFISEVILSNIKTNKGGVAPSFVYAKFYDNNYCRLAYTDAMTASTNSLIVKTHHQQLSQHEDSGEGMGYEIDDLGDIALNYLPAQYKDFTQEMAISLTNLQKEIPKYSLDELGLVNESKCWNWVCHFKATKQPPVEGETFSLHYLFNGKMWVKYEAKKSVFWFSGFCLEDERKALKQRALNE